MTTWHVEDPALARFAEGGLDEARAFSIEAHLMSCEVCCTAVARHAGPERLDRMWAEVVEVLDAPRPGLVERLLIAMGAALAEAAADTVSSEIGQFLGGVPRLVTSGKQVAPGSDGACRGD